MRNYFIFFFCLLTFSCVEKKADRKDVPASSKMEEKWEALFDGKDLDGWKGYLNDSIPAGWKIEQGVLTFIPDPNSSPGMNNLITRKEYGSFELRLEWKIEPDGNSGVFYWVQEDEKFVVPYMTAPEVQLRDYSSDPDFNDKKQMSGAIFGLVGPETDLARPAGQWNELWVKVDLENNKGEVLLNGEKLFTYPVFDKAWDSLVESSKFKDWEAFARKQKGHIGLQDHAHRVWFKKIKIRDLKAME